MSEQPEAVTVADTETVTAESTDLGNEVAKWKELAKKHEQRAKANADAASKLAQLEESQKTEAQKLAEAAEQNRREADQARSELTRIKIALRYGITEDDIDLLGDGDAEQIESRAKRLAEKNLAAAEAALSTRPRGDVDQGVRSAIPLNGDPLLRDLKSKLGIP